MRINNNNNNKTTSCLSAVTPPHHHPHLELAAAQLLAHLEPGIHRPLQVPLQPPAEVPEHGGASGEHNVLRGVGEGSVQHLPTNQDERGAGPPYLVEWAPDVDGAVLDDLVHNL